MQQTDVPCPERLVHLRDLMEQYLGEEGLGDIVAEHRKERALSTKAVPLFWAVYLWLAEVLIMRTLSQWSLGASLLLAPLMFVVSCLGITLFCLVRQLRAGRQLSRSDAEAIGGFFLFGFPMLLAVVVGFCSHSASAFVACVAATLLGLPVLLAVQAGAYQIHRLWGFVRLSLRALVESLLALPAIASLLIVFAFLAAFSEEVWQTVGGLPPATLLVGVAVTLAPMALFAILSINTETRKLLDLTWTPRQLMSVVEATDFFAKRSYDTYIAPEEWRIASDEVAWRHVDHMLVDVGAPVLRAARISFTSLIVCVGILSLVGLFVFYCLFFLIVIPQTVILRWTSSTGQGASSSVLGRLGWRLLLPAASVDAVVKVSLFVSSFLLAVLLVWTFTEEKVKDRLTAALRRSVESWLAVSAVYGAVSRPGYQVWEWRAQRSQVSATIVVPAHSPDCEVESACRHMESGLKAYALVYVTAFEQKREEPRYQRGVAGRCWELRRVGHTQPVVFEAAHFDADELRYQDELGRRYLTEGKPIADEWFGNTEQAAHIARRIWEMDQGHELVMHPYAYDSGEKYLGLEVHLYRRLETSEEYRDRLRKLLAVCRSALPSRTTFDVELYLRDSVESLAKVLWSAELPYVDYEDHFHPRSRAEAPGAWDRP
jgi:hypothetical protein